MTESGPVSGAGMYRMFEGYVLNPNRADSGSTFSRIGFRLPDVRTVALPADRAEAGDRAEDVPAIGIEVADSIPFPAFGDVVASSIVDDAPSGCQQVWFVRHAAGGVSLDRLSLAASGEPGADRTLTRTTYPLAAAWVRSIAGEAELAPDSRSLLVTGMSDEGVLVGAFDAASGTITSTWSLPRSKPGALAGSWTVVHAAEEFVTYLFATVRTATGLATVALDVCSLVPGKEVKPEDVHALPDVAVAAASTVTGTLGKMLPASGSQQLILAAAGPEGAPFVVLQGFDAGKPAQLARAKVETGFAKPRTAQYRVTCADLDNNGQEELVVAYAADYGGVSGAAAFVLFRFDHEKRELQETSHYVAAAANSTPLASMDLRLGSGILGDAVTSGVLVLGAGGDFAHVSKGTAQIFAGIVPVNPVTLKFPPYADIPATLPSVTQVAETRVTAPGILGSVADLFGLSVTLGQPEFTQLSARGQLLAILQVPPFELGSEKDKPSVTFSHSESSVKGLSVTSSKDWVMSVDAGLSLGIDSSSLNFHAGNSYGRGFSRLTDNSTTTGVAIIRTQVQLDRLITFAIDYSMWRYPIMRRSRGQESGGTMMVIFPAAATMKQETPIAYNAPFGYRAAYEPGSLLTYMNVDLDGWDETRQQELLLFTPLVSLEVTSDPPDTNTYDRTHANQETVGKSYFLASSASTSANLLKQTSLFRYLPASFGFNVSSGETYSDSEMEMTSVSRSEALSISVNGGSVKDVSMRYTVTPYVYQHAGLGATVVAFKVGNLGPGWRERFASPWPMLIVPLRSVSMHPLEKTFSRSITFEETSDTTVNIVVEVFNQGFTDAEMVNVALYRGQPTFQDERPVIPPEEDIIETVSGRVAALGRQRLRVPWTPEAKPSFVTAVVWGGNRVYQMAEIAWNVYPESAHATLNLPGVEDV